VDIVIGEGIYVNTGFFVVSILVLGLVYLVSRRLQHRKELERNLVILLILALIPAYFIVSDWDDIVWELTMESKYEIRDADGHLVPRMILEASQTSYSKRYYLTNIADVPYRVVSIRGVGEGNGYYQNATRLDPRETLLIEFHVDEPASYDSTLEPRLVQIS
jgi:hypothetical protein